VATRAAATREAAAGGIGSRGLLAGCSRKDQTGAHRRRRRRRRLDAMNRIKKKIL